MVGFLLLGNMAGKGTVSHPKGSLPDHPLVEHNTLPLPPPPTPNVVSGGHPVPSPAFAPAVPKGGYRLSQHRLMLIDKVRTLTYQQALNRAGGLGLLQGKVLYCSVLV